ncbi:MAG: TSUP family transporter [Rhizobiaceae bacterium]
MPDTIVQILGSPALIGLVVVVVMFGAFVQAGLGMGFGQAAAPLLALIDPQLVPGPVLMLGFATACWGAWRERKQIVWSQVWTGCTGRFLGAAAATVVLAYLTDRDVFMLIFGLLIGVSVIMSAAGWRLPFNRTNLVVMSGVSGLTGTITSIGAPPLAIVYADRNPKHARPTLSAFFAFGCAISLAGLFVSGWSKPSDITVAIMMVPPMVAGTVAAWLVKDRFDKRYRGLLLLLAGGATIVLVARGLL